LHGTLLKVELLEVISNLDQLGLGFGLFDVIFSKPDSADFQSVPSIAVN
jgi:hypothetical protein